MTKKALIIASVASMIDQFNMPNIKLLQELGYEVHVACNFIDAGTIPPDRTEELKTSLKNMNVKHHQVDFDRNPFNIKALFNAYKQIKNILKLDFKLVHSHSPVGGALGRIAAQKYRVKGLKSIYTAHGFHFYKGAPLKNWLTFYPIEKFLSRYTDVLITINKEDYEETFKRKFKSKETQYIKGVGIDLEKFSNISMSKNEIREKYNYESDDILLIYVAELNENKNQYLLINVMKDLVVENPKIKLLLVGTGNLNDDYKEFIEKNNLCQNVELLGYRKDVNYLLRMSDIAVASSYREGLPVNIMEAMASGLPVVATDVRGHRDLIKDNINGFLISIDKNNIFAEKVIELLNDKEKYQKFSKVNFSEDSFGKNKIIRRMKKIYGYSQNKT